MSGLFDRLQDEIEANESGAGISPVDLLDLPQEIATVIKQIIRRNGMKLAQVAEALQKPPAEVQEMLDELVSKGSVRQVQVKGEIWYKARFAKKRSRSRTSDFWRTLDVLEADES
jgi:predicted ArsR family transcriptional regulator